MLAYFDHPRLKNEYFLYGSTQNFMAILMSMVRTRIDGLKRRNIDILVDRIHGSIRNDMFTMFKHFKLAVTPYC